MIESNFPFVKNEVLRQNIDDTFNHILDLLPFTESISYDKVARSSFCKTIIIYTASIIEALLFYVFDTKFTDVEVKDYYSSWKLKDEKVLYVVDDNHKVVAGDYKKCLGEGKSKMNLAPMCAFLKDKKIITRDIFDKVDAVRILRNEQHLGMSVSIRSYTKSDLVKTFAVAKEIKEFVKKIEESL